MKAYDVLRHSGPITVAQLAMRSETDPADTLRELDRLQRERIVQLFQGNVRAAAEELVPMATQLEAESRDASVQLRVLQRSDIARVRVELARIPA